MRINKIYISAFGKLKDFTLELDNGFNIIYGDNENGKTTVMNFIKMMFYGSGKKTQNISANPRIKYTPWSGDTMGGRIFFEHSSKRYCLEREFKKSDSTDRIILTDLDTGENLPAASDIGREFFGLSAAAFERCMFIENSVFSGNDTDADGELNSKLSNLVLTGDGDISCQTVISRLESAKGKIISKSGRAGSFAKDTARLEELKARLIKAENDARRRFELNETLALLKSEYEEINTEQAETQKILSCENDIRNSEKMREYLSLKEEAEELKKSLTLRDGSIADSLYISKLNFCIGKLDTHETRINELTAEADKISTELELSSAEKIGQTKQRLAQCGDKKNELLSHKENLSNKLNEINVAVAQCENELITAKNTKKKFNPALLISGALSAVLSVFIMPVSPYLFAFFLAAGIILTALSLVIRPYNKAYLADTETKHSKLSALLKEVEKRLSDTEAQLSAINEQISVLSAAVAASAELKLQRQSDLNSKLELISAEKAKQSSAKADLDNLVERYSDSFSVSELRAELENLNAKAEQLKALRLRLNYLASDLGGITYDEAQARLEAADASSASSSDFESAKQKSEVLSAKRNDLISDISAAVTELKTGFKSSENPETVRKELNELIASLKAQKEFCDAADIACEALKESFGEIRRGYGSVLEEKALNNFTALTSGRYKGLNISRSLDITVEPKESFGTRESDYLSKGTSDQVYLSLRLAISKLISEENLPIFLDDVLSQYDDERTANAVTFLNEYSKSTQTVLFTCHGFICDIAQRQNIPLKKL